MSARFAESCRPSPLDFEGAEWDVFIESGRDGRKPNDRPPPCEEDIFIGVFFDGTNNNKYRDTPGFTHSNVARLYEVYPGMTARQTPPTLRPRVNPDGSTTARPLFPDEPFRPSSVPANKLQYHRKIYVPGVGTPMPDVGDTGTGLHKTLGMAMAGFAQVRLDWAVLQLCNQVHAAVFGAPLEDSIRVDSLIRKQRKLHVSPVQNHNGQDRAGRIERVRQSVHERMAEVDEWVQDQLGHYHPEFFKPILARFIARLGDKLKQRGDNKPTLRKIRLSVFGFSRGAAEARAWVNQLQRQVGNTLCGIVVQVDFLGLFDTVASVGVPQAVPHADGHFAWSQGENMCVPQHIRRCAHLVAAHEVRGSFPLDSVCHGALLPPNCKEIVYPGVHSDVGGGYPPNDQGRALGQGAAGDCRKLSQLPLAQMYREARMAGVPLAPQSAMLGYRAQNFAIDPQLREDFNAYVAATRVGQVPPTEGKGHLAFGTMFPTETQPRQTLQNVVSQHAAHLLRWRKTMLGQPGGAAGLPGLKQIPDDSRHQDMEDLRGAEAELTKEIAFLRNTDPLKFEKIDDPWLKHLPSASDTGGLITVLKGATPGALAYGAVWFIRDSSRMLMEQKQAQWDAWMSRIWAGESTPASAQVQAINPLFERYVHDSRAWFKPLFGDAGAKTPDDEDWLVFGGREAERKKRIRQLEAERESHRQNNKPHSLTQTEKALRQMQQEGPLVVGGREPYQLWGYLRHRRLYQSGVPVDDTAVQQALDQEERQRILDQRLADEQARHEAAIAKIKSDHARVMASTTLSASEKEEYTRGAQKAVQRERKQHAEEVARIKR
jgi:hypothetical protein